MANSIWWEVGKALRQLLVGSQRNQRSSVGLPTFNPQPQTRAESDEASPGRYGDGATRDATSAEISRLHIEYSPNPDGTPDPGEVVWTWVPFEEHDGRGKDRPVLIIGRLAGGAVAGCYLSTKQHQDFVPVGTGGWDGQGRPSYLSPERLLRITSEGMRREGHVIDRDRFDRAVAVVSKRFRIDRGN